MASKFSSARLIWKSNVSLHFSHHTSRTARWLKTLNQASATVQQSEITGQEYGSSHALQLSLPSATRCTLIRKNPPPLLLLILLFQSGLLTGVRKHNWKRKNKEQSSIFKGKISYLMYCYWHHNNGEQLQGICSCTRTFVVVTVVRDWKKN